jgi:uncharacterized heparinase superfamily protein
MSRSDSRLSFFLDPENWPLFVHTAANMQPAQLTGVAERTLRHLVVPTVPFDFDARYERSVPETLVADPEPLRDHISTLRASLSSSTRERYRDRARATADGAFTFMNRTIDFGGPDQVDWESPAVYEPPIVWTIQFHGFEFLRWLTFGFERPTDCQACDDVFADWRRDWADRTRIGSEQYLRRAWTPHAVSLRLLNWSRYYAWQAGSDGADPDDGFLGDIYKNALFLEKHVERDVGGNHLIENAVALVVAGLLFETHGERLVETGVEILRDETDQILADGGHYERSPMYHVFVLTRYLTAVHLLDRAGRRCPQSIRETTQSATAFLSAMRGSDGRIPLLNDSVYDEALPAGDCLQYADAVGFDVPDPAPSAWLDASGYYWLGDGADQLLVDGGPVGPPHLPGHSHNDLLSVQAWVDGTPVLTDTGTYDYEPNERRQFARSVRSHNTVQVDDLEPIDIGGRYVMGRRVEPHARLTTVDGIDVFDGAYEKRGALRRTYRHRRRVYRTDPWWLIWDRVTTAEPRPVRSRWHLHPDVRATSPDESRIRLSTDEEPVAWLFPLGEWAVSLDTAPYFPRFGDAVERSVVTLHSHGDDESAGVLLTTRQYDAVELAETDDGRPAVVADGVKRALPQLDRP